MKGNALFSDNRWRDVSTQLLDVLGKRNREGNTFLHVAAKNSTLKELIPVVLEKAHSLHHGGRLITIFRQQNNEKQTFMAVALNTDIDEETIRGIMDNLMLSVHGREVLEFCCRSLDSGGNTLLHLATEGARFDTISYLADKPIDEKHLNNEGFSPMHIAVDDNNFPLFKHILTTFTERLDINEPTADNETSLHLACKKGHVDMMGNIVKLGGDLSSQDEHGHTPLHDLLQQVYLEGGSIDTGYCEKFRAVWGKIVEVAVIWWCGHWKIPIPDRHSQVYQDLRRDALYYLRSCIENIKGHSVLQYAAELGVKDCSDVMLCEENVFVIRSLENTGEYEMEITNLCPEYSTGVAYDAEIYKDTAEKLVSVTRTTTLEETLATVDPPLKASAMLQGIPMMTLTTWQWTVYQTFSIAWLFFHCVVMAISSINAQEELKSYTEGVNGTQPLSAPSVTHLGFDFFVLLYASLMFLCSVVAPAVRACRRVWKYLQRKVKKTPPGPEYKHRLYLEDTEDKGFLSYLTVTVEILSEQVQIILSLLFAIAAWCLFIFIANGNMLQTDYAWLKGVFLLFGWFIVMIPGRTYSPIYNFISTLKFILIKDMIPFTLFYFIITIAFACAMQLQFQLVLNDAVLKGIELDGLQAHLSNIARVAYELLVMTVGLETDLSHVQDVSDAFKEGYQKSKIIKTLLIGYGVVSVVILLNMLIALMGTTLTVVLETEGTGWRQYQVSTCTHVFRRGPRSLTGGGIQDTHEEIKKGEFMSRVPGSPGTLKGRTELKTPVCVSGTE